MIEIDTTEILTTHSFHSIHFQMKLKLQLKVTERKQSYYITKWKKEFYGNSTYTNKKTQHTAHNEYHQNNANK